MEYGLYSYKVTETALIFENEYSVLGFRKLEVGELIEQLQEIYESLKENDEAKPNEDI